jgi:RNA polymerase sigma factor (sigma-70 family)
VVDTGLASDDDDKLTPFIVQIYDPLRRSATGWVGEHLAPDMVQETCVNLLRHCQSLKDRGIEPRLTPGFAFTILRNTMLSHFRKEKAERRRVESAGVFAATTVAKDPGILVSEDNATKEFFESLGPEQQKIALLFEAGYEPAEIADILDKAEGTVRNHMTVIRRAFKKFFGY